MIIITGFKELTIEEFTNKVLFWRKEKNVEFLKNSKYIFIIRKACEIYNFLTNKFIYLTSSEKENYGENIISSTLCILYEIRKNNRLKDDRLDNCIFTLEYYLKADKLNEQEQKDFLSVFEYIYLNYLKK